MPRVVHCIAQDKTADSEGFNEGYLWSSLILRYVTTAPETALDANKSLSFFMSKAKTDIDPFVATAAFTTAVDHQATSKMSG